MWLLNSTDVSVQRSNNRIVFEFIRRAEKKLNQFTIIEISSWILYLRTYILVHKRVDDFKWISVRCPQEGEMRVVFFTPSSLAKWKAMICANFLTSSVRIFRRPFWLYSRISLIWLLILLYIPMGLASFNDDTASYSVDCGCIEKKIWTSTVWHIANLTITVLIDLIFSDFEENSPQGAACLRHLSVSSIFPYGKTRAGAQICKSKLISILIIPITIVTPQLSLSVKHVYEPSATSNLSFFIFYFSNSQKKALLIIFIFFEIFQRFRIHFA